MPKPFGVTDIWNDGELNICSECGKKWLCKYGKKCSYWKDKDKNVQCTCSDCNPANIGCECEEIEHREKVVFT